VASVAPASGFPFVTSIGESADLFVARRGARFAGAELDDAPSCTSVFSFSMLTPCVLHQTLDRWSAVAIDENENLRGAKGF
jgi:hypothetical protein